MASNPASELVSAIQSASIKRHPSPSHDINPATAASAKTPAVITSKQEHTSSRSRSPSPSHSIDSVSNRGSNSHEDDIPTSILNPAPRRVTPSFPPLPDMRFEQSYLASIRNCESNLQVLTVTVRDQVLSPLVQGVVWNLLIYGWRHGDVGARLKGFRLGRRFRSWWWGVNNWSLPEERQVSGAARGLGKGGEGIEGVQEVWNRPID